MICGYFRCIETFEQKQALKTSGEVGVDLAFMKVVADISLCLEKLLRSSYLLPGDMCGLPVCSSVEASEFGSLGLLGKAALRLRNTGGMPSGS